jgi:DDE superfamily endonuclease
MEDVLDVYARSYDPQRPVVCADEKLVTLHADVRPPVPVAPGQAERVDYEYERIGTANLFVSVEPLAGWRHTDVTERRTKVDFAHYLHWLADERYPAAEVIVLVADHLNIHDLSVLYLVYPPAEARRLVQRFEVHHTPKHASWLNMAEIEINLIERNCLRRRVPDRATLVRHIASLESERNAASASISWRFRTEQARQKMQRVYPALPSKDEPI